MRTPVQSVLLIGDGPVRANRKRTEAAARSPAQRPEACQERRGLTNTSRRRDLPAFGGGWLV